MKKDITSTQQITNNNDKTKPKKLNKVSKKLNNNLITLTIYSCCNACWEQNLNILAILFIMKLFVLYVNS